MKSCRLFKQFAICFFTTSILLTSGCSAKTEAQKKLGADSDYFIGLKLLNEGKKKEAISKLSHAAKKGTYFCAKESAKKLCEFGSLQEKNEACEKLLKNFSGPDAILTAIRHFSESNEISKIIEYTENLDFETVDNEIIRLRLESLKKRNDSRYQSEVYKWFTSRPLSTEHYQFYRDFYEHPDFEQENVVCTPYQFAINYRIELYKRNYTYTYQNAHLILENFDSKVLPPNAQLASDIGKSYLYGSMNFATNAQQFKSYAQKFKDTPIEYYFWFYAGRFYEKGSLYQTNTKKCFQAAINCAQTPEQKDNAIWYILNTTLNTSVDSAVKSLEEYSHQWKNAEYFDDFFSTLLSSLLISGNWKVLYDVYTTVDGYASDEVVAQYAYIYARLVEEGLITKEMTGRDEQADIQKAFTRSLKSDSAVYYKILSANKLKVPEQEFSRLMSETGYTEKAVTLAQSKKQFVPTSQAAENLLTGCVLFGFPEKIYPLWNELYYSVGISTETSFYLSEFLQKCSTGDDDYLQQSLRIASRAAAYTNRPLKTEEIQLLYPQNYLNFVDTSCKKYDIKKSVVFALIRSESFFDPDVTSSAGAIGLTQLMDFTGGDIARRLHYKEYSLEDPETNIEFGTYYLSELYRRCEGSYLQSFFAYNAGITRVRRWLQSSLVEFGKKKDMPMDLFLETLPYAETREYGRKLISAGVMYEWLYNSEKLPYSEIINNFVN